MDILFRALGPGVHRYYPFRRGSKSGVVLPLQDICKRLILSLTTLRRLKSCDSLPLPPLIMQYLVTLSTEDFDEKECAPFTDVFNLNFYYRALTYRVYCRLDQCEYLATYGAARYDLSQSFDKECQKQWIDLCHPNLMPVYGIAVDEPTGNFFYLSDFPQATLKSVDAVMSNSNICMPEPLVWYVAYQLSSGLLHVFSAGLRYGPFGMDNIFLIGDKLLLENELTRQTRVETIRLNTQCVFRSSGDASELTCPVADKCCQGDIDAESRAIFHLGCVLSHLTRKPSDKVDMSNRSEQNLKSSTLAPLGNTKSYSNELAQLILDIQRSVHHDKSMLEKIKDISFKMMREYSGLLAVLSLY